MGQQVRYLLAGASLTLLLQLLAGWLGPAGLVANLFIPLPAAYAGMRQGTPVAAGIVLLSGAALVFLSGAASAVAYVFQFGLAAFVLVLMLRRGFAWDRAVAGSVLTTVAAAALLAGYFAFARDLPIATTVDSYLQQETEKAMEIYAQAGMTAEQMTELREITTEIGAFIGDAWPGLAVAGSAALLLLTVWLLAALAKGSYRLPGPPFRLWKSPDHLIWLLIAAGAGQLLMEGLPQQIALNLLIIVLPVYFLQGLAIVHFYFLQRNVAPFLRRVGYFLITIMNPLPLVVTGIGVFDLWVDFRKPRNKTTEP